MSSMNTMSYLQDLVNKANKLKTEQETRQRELAMSYESKVRQANIATRTRQAELNTSSSRVLKPKQRPLIEPDLAYTKESVSGISSLYEQAKSFDPFTTKKTETQLFEPLNYFKTLSQQVTATGQAPINKYEQQLKELQSIGTTKNIPTAYNQRDVVEYYLDLANKQEQTQQYINRSAELVTNFYNKQTTTLKDLFTEQEKNYGKNFSNVDKKVLSVADWSSWQNLEADLQKHILLRDSYAEKFRNTGKQVDKDWIKTYNDLIIDTQKQMSTEIPKILLAAQKTVNTLESTRASTVSTLEALNKTFGERSKSTLKPVISEQKKVTDIPETVSRQQVIARMDRVGSYLEKTRPAPKFESRPT